MKKFNFKKDILAHLIAVAIFYLVTVVFFSPIIFEGKVLSQHDITQAKGGAKEMLDYQEKTGEVALWTNSMFSGMPTYLMGVSHTGDLMMHVHIAMGLFLPHPVKLLFISFLCYYIMLLCFGVRSWLAIAGGIAFGFTGFSIIGLMAGHNAKIAAVGFMPLVFGGVHLAFRKRLLWGFVLTALGMALELRSNHLQITYYLLLIVLIYGLHQLILAFKNKGLPEFGKTVGVLVLAVALGVGCNLGRIWTVMEYGNYSTRGKSELTSAQKKSGLDQDYAFQYSNGIFEPIVLFIPNFYGGSGQENLGNNSNLEKALKRNGASRQQIKGQVKKAPAYWGDQPLTAPYYAGAIVIFLFVLSLIVVDSKYTGWIIMAAVLGVMMSWGKNFSLFNELLFSFLPGYNKFRSVTFTIIIPVFVMTLSGFVGLEKVLSTEWNKSLAKKMLIALSITGGFALLCVLFAGMGSYRGAIDERLASYPEWFLNALRKDRASLLRMDALRTLFFVAAFFGVIYFTIKKKVSEGLGYGLMIALMVIDMFGISKRFIDEDNYLSSRERRLVASDADKEILKDTDNYRVLNLMNPFNDGATSYHHSSIGGYHGAKMGRYQDLIEHVISKEQTELITTLRSGQIDFSELGVINMLNTKYFKAGEEARAVIRNEYINGNAWFVEDVVEATSADEEISKLQALDTKTQAVVNVQQFNTSSIESDSLANIELIEYAPNKLVYKANTGAQALAVFSEIYYPEGWTATIDGQGVDILRANYVLRALSIPAGSHEVVFEFNPKSYSIGNTVALIANILLILIFLGSLVYSLKE